MAGIYLHIPFCKQACYYCDFHFSTSTSQQVALVDALIREIYLRKGYLDGAEIQTVYFGGGTPSLLPTPELQRIFEAIHSHFHISPNAEITVEGNPDDLTAEKLGDLFGMGVNRLSIGIQSFDDEVLRWMNRAHTSGEATEVVRNALSVGFDNLSLDLIYGVPVGTEDRWAKDLAMMIDLAPSHISAYCLTIEPNTVFGRRHQKGEMVESDDEQIVQEYDLLVTELATAGYDHYEVSNFAKPGQYSRHNTSYWKQAPYLGIGPSAHSYNGITRSFAVANNTKYCKALASDVLPLSTETLSSVDLVNEYVLTSLRTSWGCDMEKIQKDFGHNFSDQFGALFESWADNGLAFWENGHIILTERGLLMADGLASALFLE